MKPYFALLGARFRLLLQYRAAALAGFATQLFFGCVVTAGLRAFYGFAGGAVAPLSLPQAVSYAWMAQVLFSLLPWRGDAEVRAMITSGGLAYELLRPVDLYGWWFARAVAQRTAPVLLRAVPLLVAALLWFGLQPPASPAAAGLWLLALAGAVALASAFTVFITLTALWTLSADGVQFILPVLVMALSGQLLPLPLFPDWMQPLLAALPFRGLLDTPNRIWLGDLAGGAAGAALANQWLWIAALVLSGRMALGRGLRRVVIQGG